MEHGQHVISQGFTWPHKHSKLACWTVWLCMINDLIHCELLHFRSEVLLQPLRLAHLPRSSQVFSFPSSWGYLVFACVCQLRLTLPHRKYFAVVRCRPLQVFVQYQLVELQSHHCVCPLQLLDQILVVNLWHRGMSAMDVTMVSDGASSGLLPWVEKYRPSSLDQLVAHEDIIRMIERMMVKQTLPHMLLHGPPGTGLMEKQKKWTLLHMADSGEPETAPYLLHSNSCIESNWYHWYHDVGSILGSEAPGESMTLDYWFTLIYSQLWTCRSWFAQQARHQQSSLLPKPCTNSASSLWPWRWMRQTHAASTFRRFYNFYSRVVNRGMEWPYYFAFKICGNQHVKTWCLWDTNIYDISRFYMLRMS